MYKTELTFLKSDNCRVFLIDCEIEDSIYFGVGYFDCLLPDRLVVFNDNRRYLIEIPEELRNKYTTSIIINGVLNFF